MEWINAVTVVDGATVVLREVVRAAALDTADGAPSVGMQMAVPSLEGLMVMSKGDDRGVSHHHELFGIDASGSPAAALSFLEPLLMTVGVLPAEPVGVGPAGSWSRSFWTRASG